MTPGSPSTSTHVFGNTVLKDKTNPRYYVKLGPNYVAMAPPGQGQASQVINHFCPGIVNFDLAATKHALDQMGIQYRETTGVGLFVPDPDGTLVQLWTENSWSRLGETATPAATLSQGEPLLRHRRRPHPRQRLERRKIHRVLREDPRSRH